jgi:hypothetical protein
MNYKTTFLFKVVISITLLLFTIGGCKKHKLVIGQPAVIEFFQVSPIPGTEDNVSNKQAVGVNMTISGGDYAVVIGWVGFTHNDQWLFPVGNFNVGTDPGHAREIFIGVFNVKPNDVKILYKIQKNGNAQQLLNDTSKPFKPLKIGPLPPLEYGKGYPLPVD